MSQFAISILRKSRRPSRSIVFVVLSIVLSAVPICVGQTMQQGISVNLPVSRNAVSIPDADRNDSLIVSVTEDGNVYLGTSPISPTALAETIKRGMSNQKGETLYIKADARTQYAKVMKVLEAARTAGVESALLTGQRDASEPGTLVPPKALTCWFLLHRRLVRSQRFYKYSTRDGERPRLRSTMSRSLGRICKAL